MATVCSVTLIKRFTYRGATEEYSNQYYLTGAIPADATAWKALADALIVPEKACYTSECSVVRAYGHDSDDPNAAAVWSYDYAVASASVPGTLTLGSGVLCPSDCAVWTRWKTSRLNSKGKPIYLRKYFHLACAVSGLAAGHDTTLAAQVTALQALGAKMRDGSFLDARTLRSRTHDETLVGHNASPYVTTRTLKRRGRRPTT